MNCHMCLVKGLAVLTAALFLWGCGRNNGNAPAFNTVNGTHPANWLDKHRPAAIADAIPSAANFAASCKECHAKDLLGGISKVSCAQCHPLPVPPFAPANHADPNWLDLGLLHGAAAKAKPSLTITGINQGFSMCQSCHGLDFNGGVVGVSCFTCHNPPMHVPHPFDPTVATTNWLNITGTDVTHTNTDPANAPTCALCHIQGANLRTPVLTSYANGQPGCFNSTLCHGGVAPSHAFPNPGSVHGLVATPPFADCLSCHFNSADNIGNYPVPAGTPPNCRGCHIKASPENGCGGCHGTDAGGGRPNGLTFPDIQGGHFAGDHPSFDCTACHGTSAGDGFPTHGPSNRIAHGDANVITDFISGGFAPNTVFTRSGNGHGTCSNVDCHPGTTRSW